MKGSKYRQDIFNVITKTYTENVSDGLSWTDLYKCVKQSLGRTLSPRDFCYHIENMIKDGVLSKNDPGRRGTRVSISLTKNAKKLHNLGILGPGKEEANNKKMLQVLVFFHLIKPPQPISAKTMNIVLSFLSLSHRDLTKYIESHFHILNRGYAETNYKPIKDYKFRIVEVYDGKRKTTQYYCKRISFSVEDIAKYAKRYKQAAIDNTKLFPFIKHTSLPKLSEDDIKKAFNTLRREGIIRPIQNIFDKPGKQLAFLIADEDIQNLINQIWNIRNLELERLQKKLTYVEGPTMKEKEWLELTYGSNRASTIIHNTSSHRNEMQNKDNSHIYTRIEGLGDRINQRKQYISETYTKVIKKFDFPPDIIEGICLDKIVLTYYDIQ